MQHLAAAPLANKKKRSDVDDNKYHDTISKITTNDALLLLFVLLVHLLLYVYATSGYNRTPKQQTVY